MFRRLFAIAIGLALNSCAEVNSRYALLKTRHAGEPVYACGEKLKAEDYCANFSQVESLKEDPNAARVRKHCLSFYGEAVRATNVLCAYFEEMDSLTFWGDGDDSPTITAKGKRIHRKYAALAEERSRALDRAYRISGGRGAEGAVEELAYDGRENLKEELECREVPGRAPPLVLLGAAFELRRDLKETFERLQASLQLLAGATALSVDRPFLALREGFRVQKSGDREDRPMEKIVSRRLNEPALLAAGKASLPNTPELERYYAQQTRTPAKAWRGGSRSLASENCPAPAFP